MHQACTERQPLPPTLAASGRPGHHDKGDDMYLRPLIHTELIRQRQQELTLRTSRARLSVEQASRSRLGKQAGKIGVLIIAAITILALTATSSYAATGKKRPNHGTPPKGATWSVFQDGTGKIIIRIGPKIIYIYYPAPA